MDNQTESKLTVLRTEVEPCRIKLDVEVPADRVSRVLKEAVGLFRKSARIPGFRSGKTPPELLAKRYGKEIQEEALKCKHCGSSLAGGAQPRAAAAPTPAG